MVGFNQQTTKALEPGVRERAWVCFAADVLPAVILCVFGAEASQVL